MKAKERKKLLMITGLPRNGGLGALVLCFKSHAQKRT